MVDYAGWECLSNMPVFLRTAVRTAAGIFDVSHMGETISAARRQKHGAVVGHLDVALQDGKLPILSCAPKMGNCG